jgi:hypothetical protein
MTQESGLETQFKLAREEAERLRQEHGTGRATARELYRRLLTFLEKQCPGVYLQLNGKALHKLLCKGTSGLSGEVLKEYRERAALRTFWQPDLPIPIEAQGSLMDAVSHIWETSYLVAKRELGEVDQDCNQAYRQQIEELQMKLQSQESELETVRANYAQAESINRLLRQKLEETSDNLLATRVLKDRLEKRSKELEDARNCDREAFLKRVDELTALSARAWQLVEARAEPTSSKFNRES